MPLAPDPKYYLAPGRYIDSDKPAIAAFAQRHASGATDERDAARRLFYAVRDEIVYDPYVDYGALDTYRASACLASGRGFCVAKAALLAAAARAVAIPARIGFADVRNHLATPRLLSLIGTDVFTYHGYTELFLGGRWIKATPTFNIGLCRKFRVKALEFDGTHDALLHPFDEAGQKHMEYLTDHGAQADVPAEMIQRLFRHRYPRLFGNSDRSADFAREAGQAAERPARG